VHDAQNPRAPARRESQSDYEDQTEHSSRECIFAPALEHGDNSNKEKYHRHHTDSLQQHDPTPFPAGKRQSKMIPPCGSFRSDSDHTHSLRCRSRSIWLKLLGRIPLIRLQLLISGAAQDRQAGIFGEVGVSGRTLAEIKS
jgi:hypothetical protein